MPTGVQTLVRFVKVLAYVLAMIVAGMALSVRAADLPFSFTAPYRIVVPFETFVSLPGADALSSICGSKESVSACTVYYARRLDCRCFPDEDHWHVHARAQFIPQIVLADQALLGHERMHIDEVRTAVDGHLATLTAKEFHSAADCEGAGREASDTFTSIMDSFQRGSNLRHHPMYVRALEEQ